MKLLIPSSLLNSCAIIALWLGASLAADDAQATTQDSVRYDVAFEAASQTARVRLCLGASRDEVRFAADSGWAMRFVDKLNRSSGEKVESDDSGWRAKNWHAGECLSYVADLGAIGRSNKIDVGWLMGDDIVAAPQLWLLRVDAGAAADARVAITLPDGWAISAPWHPDTGQGKAPVSGQVGTEKHETVSRFTIPQTPADWSAAVAFGRFNEERVSLPGGVLRLAILHGGDVAQRATLHQWFDRISQAILSAYGKLPLPDVQVLMIPIEGRGRHGVLFGQSVRGEGNSLQLLVDPTRPVSEFDDDWMAVHELSHLMHPYLGDRGSWLSEGLATYYQNVLRARAGLLTPAQAWAELADGFKRGAASRSDEPLADAAAHMHRTHAFQRIYWAGAAFWLTVDNDLRRQSAGNPGLDAVLEGFGTCCLPAYREWRPEEFVERLDSLSGTNVFSKRYREFAAQRVFPDWTSVFAELGVGVDGAAQTDTAAGGSARRDAIMRPRIARK